MEREGQSDHGGPARDDREAVRLHRRRARGAPAHPQRLADSRHKARRRVPPPAHVHRAQIHHLVQPGPHQPAPKAAPDGKIF